MKLVSIIIVNYKNPPLILQCVQSILQFEKTVNYEIIVVDNDSQDDTEQQLRAIYPNLKWIQMGYNSGFAKANNAGVKVAQGEYILYLNSDTILIEPILEKMVYEFGNDPAIGILGCKLLNIDFSNQNSYFYCHNIFKRLIRRNPFSIKIFRASATPNQEETKLKRMMTKKHNPQWISGAIMMLRHKEIEKFNLLWDEDFFMWWEDVELCNRIHKYNLKVQYIPKPSIIHLGGGSSKTMSAEKFLIGEKSKLLYISKTRGVICKTIYVFLLKLELRLELFFEKRKYGKIKNTLLQYESEFYGIK